jgi:hypothetical protein
MRAWSGAPSAEVWRKSHASKDLRPPNRRRPVAARPAAFPDPRCVANGKAAARPPLALGLCVLAGLRAVPPAGEVWLIRLASTWLAGRQALYLPAEPVSSGYHRRPPQAGPVGRHRLGQLLQGYLRFCFVYRRPMGRSGVFVFSGFVCPGVAFSRNVDTEIKRVSSSLCVRVCVPRCVRARARVHAHASACICSVILCRPIAARMGPSRPHISKLPGEDCRLGRRA